MTVSIEADEMSDVSKLNFDYEIVDFGEEKIEMQLNFDEKSYVSVSPLPDLLVIELNDLRDKEGKLIVEQ